MLFKIVNNENTNSYFEVEAGSAREAAEIALAELGWYIEYITGLNANSCTNCGGIMTWCDLCRQWSATCCEKYGSCRCS